MAEYAAPRDEARKSGDIIFFAGKPYFGGDAELRGKWVVRGDSATFFMGHILVDSRSPRHFERVGNNAAVGLETGKVEWMSCRGSNSGISAVFLRQRR